MKVKTGLGLDSHRFIVGDSEKPFILGGVTFADVPPLEGNSDADVVLHAVTDAISGITGVTVIGAVADQMCNDGVEDSREYLKVAMESLGTWQLTHVSIVLECQRPKIDSKVSQMQESVARLLSLKTGDVCITATSGERLTDFGRGLGIHASALITAVASQ